MSPAPEAVLPVEPAGPVGAAPALVARVTSPLESALSITPAAVLSTIRLVGSSSHEPPWVFTVAAPRSRVSPEVSIWPPLPFGP
jgi:hypothetical protein